MSWQERKLLRALRHPQTASQAFEQVVSTYQEPLYWHIRKMVFSHEDSNDILQNIFLKAWNALPQYRGEASLSTWLYRIATNEALTYLNKQEAQAKIIGLDLQEELLGHLTSDPYFDGDEAQLTLQKAILTLPEKQRLVFNMKYFTDMTYEQMGEILSTSTGALKASYHHAVKKIEEYLKNSLL